MVKQRTYKNISSERDGLRQILASSLPEFGDIYRAIVENSPDAIFIIGKDDKIEFINTSAARQLQRSKEGVIGQPRASLFPPEIADQQKSSLEKVFQNGESQLIESAVSYPDHLAWLSTWLIPIRDELGEIQAVLGISRDITQRKQAEIELARSELALRQSETSYRGLFNTVQEAIYIQDAKGYFLDVNQGAVEMYGYPREFFIGKTPESVSAPGLNDLPAIRKAVANAFAGTPQQFEFWGRRSNGEIFPKDVRLYRGTYLGQEVVIALAQDITERKKSEELLKRQLKELTTLHAVSKASVEVSAVDDLIERVTRVIGEYIYPDNFGVLLLDPSGDHLIPHPSYRGITIEDIPRIIPLNMGVVGEVAGTGRTLRIEDVQQCPGYLEVNAETRSELCAPIIAGEKILGVINAESRQLNAFSEADERLLDTLAGELATGIERIRLFEAEQSRRREAEMLGEATAALISSLDLRALLETIMESLAKVVAFDCASIILARNGGLEMVAERGLPKNLQFIGKRFNPTYYWEVLKTTNTPVVLPDCQADPKFEVWDDSTFIRGWMAVPLICRGKPIGYFSLDSRQVNGFSRVDAELVQPFANQAAAAIENAELFEALQRSNIDLAKSYDATIEGWSRALDMRDRETEGHTQRVLEMTLKLARAMGVNEEDLVHIQRGALLHDIGKMGVPDSILLKPGPLDDIEWEIMHLHPVFALDMLSPITYLRQALDIPYCHHEKWDGTGYPRGLKGDEIPLSARIFAVVDVWDALSSSRTYRPALPTDKVLEYVRTQSGKHFDPRVVDIFFETLEEKA